MTGPSPTPPHYFLKQAAQHCCMICSGSRKMIIGSLIQKHRISEVNRLRLVYENSLFASISIISQNTPQKSESIVQRRTQCSPIEVHSVSLALCNALRNGWVWLVLNGAKRCIMGVFIAQRQQKYEFCMYELCVVINYLNAFISSILHSAFEHFSCACVFLNKTFTTVSNP